MISKKQFTKTVIDKYGDEYIELVRCPKCESEDIKEFVYGDISPDYHEEITRPESKMEYQGCDVSLDSPQFQCNACLEEYTEMDVMDSFDNDTTHYEIDTLVD